MKKNRGYICIGILISCIMVYIVVDFFLRLFSYEQADGVLCQI